LFNAVSSLSQNRGEASRLNPARLGRHPREGGDDAIGSDLTRDALAFLELAAVRLFYFPIQLNRDG
jgi:hypothetical protein